MNETLDRQLELLSTDHCTLCDKAFEMLISDPNLAGWRLRVRDIVDDSALLERYGSTIPVLRFCGQAQEQELCWPFDAIQVQHWLQELGKA